MHDAIMRKCRESVEVKEQFFRDRAAQIITLCHAMAEAFQSGGRLASTADYSFVVPSFSIHRIQETHVALLHIVWDLVHVALGEEDVI